jgi:hypothetical protein
MQTWIDGSIPNNNRTVAASDMLHALAKHTLDTLLSLASTMLLPSRGHWKMDMPGQHGPGSHTEDTCYSCYTVTTEAFSSFPESFSTS